MSTRKRMPSYRPWGSTEDGAIEFESMTTETLEGGLNVIRESFFRDESVSVGVDLLSEPGASEELEALCLDAARDGVSVVAIDVSTGQVVGVAFNKIQVQGEAGEKSAFEIFSENCKYKASKALVDFMITVDAKLDLFKHYNVDCILECMFLATLKSHRKKRIAELLVASTIEIGRQLKRGKNVRTPVEVNGNDDITNANATPSLVSAIMTSNYSQKLGEKLGFTANAEMTYDEFVFAGKKFSERIGDVHKTARLVSKRL